VKIIEVLVKIAKKFNENDIEWAVGASLLLYFHDIVKEPHDIDIIIDKKDEAIVLKIMKELGNEKEIKDVKNYKTGVFHKFNIENVGIDIIGEFIIILENEEYLHPFPIKNKEYILVDNTKIYLDSLLNWVETYNAMGDPKKRVNLIENHLKNK